MVYGAVFFFPFYARREAGSMDIVLFFCLGLFVWVFLSVHLCLCFLFGLFVPGERLVAYKTGRGFLVVIFYAEVATALSRSSLGGLALYLSIISGHLRRSPPKNNFRAFFSTPIVD